MQIDVIVLPDRQDAIERGKPNRHRHVTGEFFDIQKLPELRRKRRVVRFRHQLREVDHALRLLDEHLVLRVVSLFVLRPIVAEIGENAGRNGLEDRALLFVKSVFGEIFVDVLHDRVEADVLMIVFPSRKSCEAMTP